MDPKYHGDNYDPNDNGNDHGTMDQEKGRGLSGQPRNKNFVHKADPFGDEKDGDFKYKTLSWWYDIAPPL